MRIVSLNVNHAAQLARLTLQNKYSVWSETNYYDFFTLEHCKGVHGFGVIDPSGSSDDLVGFILGCTILDTSDIYMIVVDKAHRGRGIGLWLLNHYIAVQRGPCFLEVSVLNAPAIALYKRANFATIAIRKNYYKVQQGHEDAYVMKYAVTDDEISAD